MSNIKLTVVPGAHSLSIPARTIRTIESAAPGAYFDAPAAQSIVRFVVGNQVRTRVVAEDCDVLQGMLKADKVARQDFVTVDLPNGQRFAFLPTDLFAVESLDPEAPSSNGCTALIDLEIEGVAFPDLYAKADAAELEALMEPPAPGDVVAQPKPRRGKTAH